MAGKVVYDSGEPGDFVESNRTSDYWLAGSAGDEEFFSHDVLSEYERFSSAGWRAYIRAKEGSGYIDRIRLADGVEVGLLNYVMPHRDRQVYEADEGIIFLYASLSSNMTFSVEGHPPIRLDHPELTLINVPCGTTLKVEIEANVRQQRLIGMFRHSAFGDAFKLTMLGQLPQSLADAVAGKGEFGRLVSVPLEEHTANLLTDTMDTHLQGEMRAMQYLARLVELSAFALNAIITEPAEPERRLQTAREVELARLARERLSVEYRKPPDLCALAYEFGSNPNKLRSAFKRAYGITMAEYCRDRRMREAQRLLLEPNLTIAQVAEQVGYEYPSGFAAAFSAHVGMTPRAYRRHRADLRVAQPTET